jgi:hypothetical protein
MYRRSHEQTLQVSKLNKCVEADLDKFRKAKPERVKQARHDGGKAPPTYLTLPFGRSEKRNHLEPNQKPLTNLTSFYKPATSKGREQRKAKNNHNGY